MRDQEAYEFLLDDANAAVDVLCLHFMVYSAIRVMHIYSTVHCFDGYIKIYLIHGNINVIHGKVNVIHGQIKVIHGKINVIHGKVNVYRNCQNNDTRFCNASH
jgi:hypothetical protein